MSSGFILSLPGVVQNPGQLHVATNNLGQGSFALAAAVFGLFFTKGVGYDSYRPCSTR